MENEVIAEAKSTYWMLIRDIILMVVFIGFLLFIMDFINYILGQKLNFTSKNVYGKIGILNTKKLNSPLNKINNVGVDQNLLGKILGYGTIKINTSSSIYEFKYINKPDNFANKLNEQIEIYNDEKIKKQAEELANAMRK